MTAVTGGLGQSGVPQHDLARVEYDLRVHAALLRSQRAVLAVERARRGAEDEHPALSAIDAELAVILETIACMPRDSERRPMLDLAQRLRWGSSEIEFIWCAVALAANPRLLVHARTFDRTAARGLSLALYGRIATLSAEAERELGLLLLPGHSAMRAGLLLPSAGDWLPSAEPWMPAPELIRFLAGAASAEGLVKEITAPGTIVLDALQEKVIAELASILGASHPLIVYVEGPELAGRRTAVSLAARQRVLHVDLTKVAPSPRSISEAVTVLRRETTLLGAVPVIVGTEELISDEGARDPRLRALAQQIELFDSVVVLVSTWRGLDAGARVPAVRVEWPLPDAGTRARLWHELAGAHDDAPRLAHRFALGAGSISRAITSARVVARGRETTAAELIVGVRQNIAERMGGIASRVEVKQSWDDLVLTEEVNAQLRMVIGRVRHAPLVYESWGYQAKMPKGTGVAALFSGPPGTGKTMAAGLIARELDLELYQVDLSKVISKWIGETEKQLAKVFDAAEAGHVLLLFDEADSLFGQRSSEMKSATDRYANLEVNFLLQRLESFNGVVVLTTNLDASIDKAFKRRLAANVVFQHPDDDERERLWKRQLFARGAPLSRDINLRELARGFPKMTGANIRNAALGAAFLAADERRSQICHAIVVRAARSEYLSMGLILATVGGL